MKRFLIKLIATTLLLIVILSSFGCESILSTPEDILNEQLRVIKEKKELLSEIEVELPGYKLVKTDTELPQKIPENTEFIFDGEIYSYTVLNKDNDSSSGSYGISLKNIRMESIKVVFKEINIDSSYMKENSTTYNDLLTCENPRSYVEVRVYSTPVVLLEFDERIFIYFKSKGFYKATYLGGNYYYRIPMIFEYNPTTEALKYAGIGEVEHPDDFYHQNYMIVKE